jgi:O-antigen ligase
LIVAVGMMAVGLVMSYSRGAWTATAVGLLYLAWGYGKFKWRYVLPVVVIIAAVLLYHWGSTPDSAPWYIKRADLGRPSAQHRVAAWKAGLHIMWDHPLGVGWNQAVSLYDKSYSPPEGGAAALTMNSYLMLGTELGLPGLICFVAYVALAFKGDRSWKLEVRKKSPHLTPTLSPPAGSGDGASPSLVTWHSSLRAACRAGALVFVVAFWFDGGLFDLPTAALFWVLLELGAARGKDEGRIMNEEVNLKGAT